MFRRLFEVALIIAAIATAWAGDTADGYSQEEATVGSNWRNHGSNWVSPATAPSSTDPVTLGPVGGRSGTRSGVGSAGNVNSMGGPNPTLGVQMPTLSLGISGRKRTSNPLEYEQQLDNLQNSCSKNGFRNPDCHAPGK